MRQRVPWFRFAETLCTHHCCGFSQQEPAGIRSWFGIKRPNHENLTALTTFSVKRGAGKKNPGYQSIRCKKPPKIHGGEQQHSWGSSG